jgi:hypothetical protein
MVGSQRAAGLLGLLAKDEAGCIGGEGGYARCQHALSDLQRMWTSLAQLGGGADAAGQNAGDRIRLIRG